MNVTLPARVISLPMLVGCALLSGCGSSTPSLNTASIERAIAASILTQHRERTTVVCPSKVPRRAGYAFACTARLDVGSYPVTVTETNGAGHVRYTDSRPLVALDIAKVEQAITLSIARQRQLAATVSCPAEVLQQAGLAFTCTAHVKGNPKSYPFSVTEIDNAGHVRYVGR